MRRVIRQCSYIICSKNYITDYQQSKNVLQYLVGIISASTQWLGWETRFTLWQGCIHWTEDWVGLRAGLGAVQRITTIPTGCSVRSVYWYTCRSTLLLISDLTALLSLLSVFFCCLILQFLPSFLILNLIFFLIPLFCKAIFIFLISLAFPFFLLLPFHRISLFVIYLLPYLPFLFVSL
jgi:hypothetical protein